MQESKREEDRANEGEEGQANGKPESATSKETLSDIQDSEKESGPTAAKRDPGPSPDGRLDEPDELKDAGPMWEE